MPPFVPRARDGEQMICEGCQAWNKRVAVFKKHAVLQNPTAELQGRDGNEWFHGSKNEFEEFGAHGSHHWNTLLGHHFTAEHQIAEKFSKADKSGGWHESAEPSDDAPSGHIVHTRLHIKRPKTYRSEHDMDQEVYEHERAQGNHIDTHLDAGAEDDGPHGHRQKYRGDSERHFTKDEWDHGQYADHQGFHPVATGWLNSHPDKENIAHRFKQRLKDQGYDGIVYGNSFEETQDKGPKHRDYYDHPPLDVPEVSRHNQTVPQHSISAIAFEPHQIEPTQHHYGDDCKTPEELSIERRKDSALPHLQTGHSQHYLPSMDSLHLTHSAAKTAAWDDDDDDDRPEHCDECGEEHTEDEGHRECAGCGERHGDYEEKDRHESTMTDWDETYPRLNDTVHRVLPHMRLPDHVHQVVHDESRPMYERGQALLDHVHSEHGHGLGMHWSDVFGEGRGHGADKFAGVGGGDPHDTQVVLHAHKPHRDDIEEDPDTLDDHKVYGYDVHDENEVPIAQRAPVHITGLSWRPGGHHQQWRRHDLKKPIEMTAKKGRAMLPKLRTLAHDATENQAIRHCPFCGSGKIIGQADGTVECEFCHQFFTVQVQPQFPNFPQTIDGQPQQVPGMPGQVETPEGAMGGGMPGELPPGEDDGNPFAEDGEGAEEEPEGDEDGSEEKPPPFAMKAAFRTVTGAILGEDDYARHLAIRLAPDRAAMISAIRTERGAQ